MPKGSTGEGVPLICPLMIGSPSRGSMKPGPILKLKGSAPENSSKTESNSVVSSSRVFSTWSVFRLILCREMGVRVSGPEASFAPRNQTFRRRSTSTGPSNSPEMSAARSW